MQNRATAGPLAMAWGSGMCAAGFASQLVSAALWMPHGETHIVWLPGAVLLAALLTAPISCWTVSCLGFWAGIAATALPFGLSVAQTLLIVSPIIIAAPITAYLLVRLAPNQMGFYGARSLPLFIGIAVFVLPLISASAVYWISRRTAEGSWLIGGWLNTVLAHSIGYALYVPAWISLVQHHRWLLNDRRHALTMACALALLLALWILWSELGNQSSAKPLLLLAPILIALWASFRLRILGTCLMLLAIGIIASRISIEGKGPFAHRELLTSAVSLQLWMLILAIASLIQAALVEQRRIAMSELLVANIEVRELAGRLIAAQEQERTRIARDLHDDISQRLASSSIQLSALRRRVEASLQNNVKIIQDELISLANDVRHLSHDLHPSMLRQTGLAAALDELCLSKKRVDNLTIDLSIGGQPEWLSEQVALCLYRASQEAIGNAVRHGRPGHIHVSLDVGRKSTKLMIVDNGQGFETTNSGHAKSLGLGLVSIDERAKLLGGSFAIQSKKGGGTSVCVIIPTVLTL